MSERRKNLDRSEPVRIFVSYSHRDAAYLEEDSLLGFLRGLEREGLEFWSDRKIATGEKWDEEVRRRLVQTDIALVLVSQAFLDSAYCTEVEIREFLEKSRERGLVIFPVILSPCEWRRHRWLESRLFSPGGDRTLEEHFVDAGRRKRLFLDLRTDLRRQAEKCREKRSVEDQDAKSSQPRAISGQPCEKTGERRMVTVVSFDLQALAGKADAEDLVGFLPSFRQRIQDAVERLGGRVGQQETLGPRLLAYFGYPKAHGDDVRRAVEAARDAIRDLEMRQRLFSDGQEERFEVRAGVDSGLVVVARSADGTEEQLCLGELPSRSYGILRHARAREVLVSAVSHRLIERDFHCVALRERSVSGFHEPETLFRVVELAEKSQMWSLASLPPVGREKELALLMERWESARQGLGQVVLLSAAAGLGKTRLTKAMKAHLVADSRTLLEWRCSSIHRNTPFYPILEFQQRLLNSEEEAEVPSAATRDESLASQLARLSEILGFSGASSKLPLEPGPEEPNKPLLGAALEHLLAMARECPLVLIVEDLEWADPSTLELLGALVEQAPTWPLLVVATFRPRFLPPWPVRAHFTSMSLNRLSPQQVEALIQRCGEGVVVGSETRRQIASKADGVPLFVEELTKYVLETRKEALTSSQAICFEIPPTLQNWLTARLDRLGPAKRVAQLAAALGREFDWPSLQAITALEDEALNRELERLQDAEFIFRQGWPPTARYTFKHALIRDAAHESMLRRERRETHRQIAQVLEKRFPEYVTQCPEAMARHYHEAGLDGPAVRLWHRAAKKALASSAHLEAVGHARQGLEALRSLERSKKSLEEEIGLQITLGASLGASQGYAAPETEAAYQRAEMLCWRLGAASRSYAVLEALVSFRVARGEVEVACAMAEEMLAAAHRSERRGSVAGALRLQGVARLLRGDFERAREALEEGIERTEALRGEAVGYTENPALPLAVSLGDLSWALWFLGHSEEAIEASERSLRMARREQNPASRAFVLFRAAYLRVFLDQTNSALELAQSLVKEAERRGLLFFKAAGGFLVGHCQSRFGAGATGLRAMSQGIDGIWATGVEAGRPRNLAYFAQACAYDGKVDQGLSLVLEALEGVEEYGERHFEAELLRLKGDLLALKGGCPKAVEKALRQSLQVARRQGTRAIEARTQESLGAFLGQSGREFAA